MAPRLIRIAAVTAPVVNLADELETTPSVVNMNVRTMIRYWRNSDLAVIVTAVLPKRFSNLLLVRAKRIPARRGPP